MFLIQNSSLLTRNQYQMNQSQQWFSRIKSKPSLFYQNQSQKSLNSYIHEVDYSFSVIKKIVICEQTRSILVQLFQFSDKLLTINNKFLRIQLVKRFLIKKIKNNNMELIIHPKSGQISITKLKINYCNHQSLLHFLQQYIVHCSSTIVDNAFKQFNNLLIQLNDLQFQNYCQQSPSTNNLSQSVFALYMEIKKIIMHSPYYSWTILSSIISQKLFRIDAYAQSKFLIEPLTKILVKKDQFCQNLKKLYNVSVESLINLIFYSKEEDYQIKAKYLSSTIIGKQAFIKNININQQFFQAIPHKTQIKINSGQGPISIRIHKFPQNKRNQLRFEKQLLQKMPNDLFPGLTKYYFMRNFEAQTQLYRFTNLCGTVTLQVFINSNSETISLQSKINIFTQIILSLRYLRNCQIVYFNLIPENIFIKKTQLVKLFNFTNSSCKNCPQNNSLQSKLPYVIYLKQQKFLTHQQQKSDVFSFGCLLYKIIFEKFPLTIKDSSLFNMHPEIYAKKISTKIISTQILYTYKYDIMKLLMYFCLKSYDWKTKIKNNQFQDIPFLDWAVVFIKYLKIYLQNQNI